MTTSSQRPQGNVAPIARSPRPIDPGVTIGHVHLRTADIDRVRGFYVDLLGFDVVAEARDVPGWGTTGDILFVSAGGYHHHLGFNTWKSAGGGPQPDGVAGLHHVAIRYPTRAGLADALRRLQSVDWPLRQVTDHGTHEAIYISDPDGNDLELCWDRPFDEWPLDGDGRVAGAVRRPRPRRPAEGAPARRLVRLGGALADGAWSPAEPWPAPARSTRPMAPTTIIAATSAAMAHLLIPSSASMLSALITHLGAT